MSVTIPFVPRHGQQKNDPRHPSASKKGSDHSRSYHTSAPMDEARLAFAHRDKRREDAKERAEARSKLTAEQQLAILDANPYVGKNGAQRERARLLAQIAAAKIQSPVPETTAPANTESKPSRKRNK